MRVGWVAMAMVAGVLASRGVVEAADCDGNGVGDADEIAAGTVRDCNANGLPDGCDLFPLAFAATTLPAPPGSPVGITAMDLDADGDADLAFVHPASDIVSVLMNAGDGTFAGTGTTATGDQPAAVVAAELDPGLVGLGSTTSLVVANALGDSVTILRNLGDGTFTEAAGSPHAVGDNPTGLAVGDLTGDGVPDVVVANRGGSSISVLVGNGVGGYTVGPPTATAAGPQTLVLADVDGDRDLDVLVASRTAGQLSLHRNTAGALGATENLGAITEPVALAAADVSGDGIVDVAVASLSGTVHLLAGSGTGTFAPLGTVAVGPQTTSVALADLDGDGLRDLVATSSSTATLVVARNGGGGSFTERLHLTTGAGPVSLAVADLDGDGRPDLATGNAFAGTLDVFLQAPAPGARDCNGTGIPDQCELTGADCNANGAPDACDLVPGFRFAPPAPTALDRDPFVVVPADFDGDGDADVAYLPQGVDEIRLLQRGADGGLTAWTTLPMSGGPRALVAVDLEPDGDVDLAATAFNTDSTWVFRNLGAGVFDTPTTNVVGDQPSLLAAADLDGDLDADLVVGGAIGNYTVLRNAGTSFVPLGPTPVPVRLTSLVIADADHDGVPEMVTSYVSPGTLDTGLVLFANDGSGGFTPLVAFGILAPPELRLLVVSPDLDRDGFPELVTLDVTHGGDLRLVVFHNDAGAGLTETDRLPMPLGEGPGAALLVLLFGAGTPTLVAPDLDGDGDPDLAVVDLATRGMKAFQNLGAGTFGRAVTVGVPDRPLTIAASDVDRDGVQDLLVGTRANSLVDIRSTSPPTSEDCLASGVPDECEFQETDCNANRTPDTCELPATDGDGDGIPDCAERDVACRNCRDDDGDGMLDHADASCPATPLALRRAVASTGARRGGRLRIAAEIPTALAAAALPARLTIRLAGRTVFCGPVALTGRRNTLRTTGADGALRKLTLEARPRRNLTRVRALLQGTDVVPADGAPLEVTLDATSEPFFATAPVRKRGRRFVAP